METRGPWLLAPTARNSTPNRPRFTPSPLVRSCIPWPGGVRSRLRMGIVPVLARAAPSPTVPVEGEVPMRLGALLGTAGLAVAVTVCGASVFAQESPPQYPADIRTGTCVSLSDAIVQLAPLAAPAGNPKEKGVAYLSHSRSPRC